MGFLDKVFKRQRKSERASAPNREHGIPTYDSSFSVDEVLRDPSRLASDRSLRCARCGKRPLLKKNDIVEGGPVAFKGSFDKMMLWRENLQKIADATAHMRAVRCTACGRVYCFECGMSRGRMLSGGARGCLECGAALDVVI
jgi:DNA-directed RNA polymerase subunit RPC12/RpoP